MDRWKKKHRLSRRFVLMELKFPICSKCKDQPFPSTNIAKVKASEIATSLKSFVLNNCYAYLQRCGVDVSSVFECNFIKDVKNSGTNLG